MSIIFPYDPNPGQTYSFGNNLWVFNGSAWNKTTEFEYYGYVASFNGLTGHVIFDTIDGGTY
jgi:hypothetical protein